MAESLAVRRAADGDEASRTRTALIDAGERLYAERGIEGANLLAIAREAGQANKSAVQYHFGDRSGLLRAILDARVAWLEARRADWLTTVGPQPDLHTLMRMVLLPIAELTDAAGRRTYARFLLQFMTQFEPWRGVQHPLLRPHAQTALDQIWRHVRARLPHLPRDVVFIRWDWCLRTFLGLLVDHDNAVSRGQTPPSLDLLIAEALEISVGAMSARRPPVEGGDWAHRP